MYFLGSALNFIQITGYTYVFANKMQLKPSDIVVSPDVLRLF